jgi:hypothetical protein
MFDVTGIVGKSSDGEIICKKKLNTTIPKAKRLEISCQERPDEILLNAKESSCQKNTVIYKAVFTETEDGEKIWVAKEQKCEE